MGYKHLNLCFDTKQEFLDYVAQGCFANQGGSGSLSSYILTCSSNVDTITVQAFLASTGNPQTAFVYTPQLITCEPNNLTNADIITLAWLVFGVWAAAWGIKKILDLLSKND